MVRMDIWDMIDKILDRIDKLEDNNNCSPLTCPFNLKITQLFTRIKRLENDMKGCKEHYKKILEGRG